MKPNSMSVAMDSAVRAFALKHQGAVTETELMAHALAHGTSVSGLRVALRRSNLIPQRKARKAAQSSPD